MINRMSTYAHFDTLTALALG